MLRIYSGSARSGQSQRLCRDMVDLAVKNPEKNFIALVPEQSTLKMQKDAVMMHPFKSVINIDVLSFQRLAEKIFKELGLNERELLDSTGKILILRNVLNDCRDKMTVYKSKIRMPGFVTEMKSMITELKQYDLDDNSLFLMQQLALEHNNKLLYGKLADIRLILDNFNSAIKDRYSTEEELLDVCARVMDRSNIVKGTEIFLDGFTGFTPVQFKILESFFRMGTDINVSLTLPTDKIDENSREFDLFNLSNKTYFKLKKIAEKYNCELMNVSAQYRAAEAAGSAVNVNSEAAEAASSEKEARIKVHIRSAASPEEELRDTAEYILGKIKHCGYRFRDFAVILSDMEGYRPLAERIFREAGIVAFIDYKNNISGNVMSRFIMAALKTASMGMHTENVFSVLKCAVADDMTDNICLLENYCLEFGIDSVRSFSRPLIKNRKTAQKDFYDLDKLNSIKKESSDLILKFYKAVSHADGKTFVSEITQALKELCLDLKMQDKMAERAKKLIDAGELSKGKEYEQIFDLVMELLDKSEMLLRDENISIREFSDIISDGLKEIKVSVIPPSIDELTVGDLTRTRLDNIKVLFLLGTNDGKVPVMKSDTGIFTRRERELLKTGDFEMAPTGLQDLFTQRFYLHLLMSRPEESLIISYAEADGSGEKLAASYIINDLDELAPSYIIEDPGESAASYAADVANESSAVSATDSSGETAAAGAADKPNESAAVNATDDPDESAAPYAIGNPGEAAAAGAADAPETAAGEHVHKAGLGYSANGDKKAGKDSWLSAAALDLAVLINRYAAGEKVDIAGLCSFFAREEPEILKRLIDSAFFNNVQLPLDKQTALDLYGGRLKGSVSRYEKFSECAFAAFLKYGIRIDERPRYKVEAADVGSLYHESLERYSKKLEEKGFSFRDINDEDSISLSRESVKETIGNLKSDAFLSTERNKHMLRHMEEVLVKTTDVLRKQVRDGLFEPSAYELVFENNTKNGTDFNGKIDRVDIYDSGDIFVKVIDYKSGSKKFSIEDIWAGTQLQLLAYMNAAVKEIKKKNPGKNVIPGGVYYYRIQDRFIKDEKEDRNKFKMSGLTNSDPRALTAVDKVLAEGGDSEIVEVGWAKDGLKKSSKAADTQEFLNLCAYAEDKLDEISERIQAGEVFIKPFKNGSSDACTYCSYHSACKFEPGLWDNDYNDISAVDKYAIKGMLFHNDRHNDR